MSKKMLNLCYKGNAFFGELANFLASWVEFGCISAIS